jgi:hypothetical protein
MVVICFDNLGFRVFNSLPSLSPILLSSRFRDLLTCVSHKSTTMIHFGPSHGVHGFSLRCLTNLTATIYFGSSPGVHGFMSCVLLNWMAMIHFQSLPGIHEILPHVLLNRTARIHFGSLPRVHEFLPHVLMNRTVMIHFRYSSFGSFKSCTLTF